MKHTQKKPKNMSQEEIMEEVQKIFKERGGKALEMARKEVLEEEIECKEVREALKYFMTEYWQDLSRAALLSLCCEALGGNPDATIPIAIPLSLISGGVDIHDDIIDQSRNKEGRPTVYGKFGKEIALLVGDALLFKGLTLLSHNTKVRFGEKMLEIMGVVKDTFFELGESEALELEFKGRLDVAPEEYLSMVKMRAANVETDARIGATIGGGKEVEVETFGKYGRALGMLLIIRDDFVDMFEKEELSHRMHFECLPLPLLCALQNPRIKNELVPMIERKAAFDLNTILDAVLESSEVKNLKKSMANMIKDNILLLDKLDIDESIRFQLELLLLAAGKGL